MRLWDEVTNSSLFCSLYGVKRVFEKQLDLTNIFWIFNNDKKSPLKRQKDPKYPYAYFSISSIQINKEGANVKSIRRGGITNRSNNFDSASGVTNATIHKYFLFPTTLTCELHYFHDDVKGIIKFLEVMLLLSVTDTFNFYVKMNEEAQWITEVTLNDDSISVPEYDFESQENPAASEIVITFSVKTRMGFVRDVAKVKDTSPTITFALNTEQATTEVVP